MLCLNHVSMSNSPLLSTWHCSLHTLPGSLFSYHGYWFCKDTGHCHQPISSLCFLWYYEASPTIYINWRTQFLVDSPLFFAVCTELLLNHVKLKPFLPFPIYSIIIFMYNYNCLIWSQMNIPYLFSSLIKRYMYSDTCPILYIYHCLI